MIEFLCRPDTKHWCTECCPQDCSLLRKLSDNSEGCLAHSSNSNRGENSLPQRSICQKFNCLSLYPEIKEPNRQNLVNIIGTLPSGQFKISKILSDYKKNQ